MIAFWLPIATAPKGPPNKYTGEGPAILLCGGFTSDDKPSVRTGHWKALRTNGWCDTALGRCPLEPTHWMPLPEPPCE